MAKKTTWSFEDYFEAARLAAIAVTIAVYVYEETKKVKAALDRKAADKWVREACARMDAMCNHGLGHGITKEGYDEAISMARNLIAFEAVDVLGDNVYMGDAVNEVNMHLNRRAKLHS